MTNAPSLGITLDLRLRAGATWALYDSAFHLVEDDTIDGQTCHVACIAGSIVAETFIHVVSSTSDDLTPAEREHPICGTCRATLEDIADVE